MTPMMEARSIKSPDEQKAVRIVGSICDALHYEFTQFLKPGLTENEVAAFGFEYLYSIPGMEDVEDVIVSSGPNAWPNWRNFSDRIIRPGELVIIDLAALTWNGFKSCVYRTYCVGGRPTDEMKRTYETAHTWLWDSIETTRPGTTTREIAEVALGEGGLGLRGGGPGRGEPLGSWARPGAVRPAGDLAHLVARPPGRDRAGHGVRPGDAARQGP
jgi:Xaa-Pro aminopeptidase